MTENLATEIKKKNLINRISRKGFPSNWDDIIKELKLTEFEGELSRSVVKIETFYRSKLARSIEYIYAFVYLINSLILRGSTKNITIGHFQIGILTSLRWTRTEVNFINYFKRIIQLSRFRDSIRIFRIGLHYFERRVYNLDRDYIDQFAQFYNGTPTQSNSRIKYSVVLNALIGKWKKNDSRNLNINTKNESFDLDTSKMRERFNSIKSNIVKGEDLCLSVILCDKHKHEVIFSDFWGSNSNSLPVLNKRRSIASTIKVALYACYLEKYSNDLHKIFEDKKLSLKWHGETIVPRNVDNKFRGEVTLKYAFSYSINTIAIQLINELGIREFVRYLRIHGIYQPLPNTPLLALGAIKLTGWELLSLLSPVIYDGHLLYMSSCENDPLMPFNNGRKIISDSTVTAMRKLLNSVVDNGTGKYLKNNYQLKLGGKTGTSEKNRDLWFIGTINDQYYGLVWLGMEDEKEMISKDEVPISATRYAVPLWSDLLRSFSK